MTDASSAIAGRPIRVVLVDDTSDIRLLLRIGLEREGGLEIVGEAGDGEAGVRVIAELQPDVVLLDLAMPVMDGLRALPLICECAPDTKVIILSGFEADSMAEDAVRAGAATYIQKGARIKEIAAAVREVGGVAASSEARDDPSVRSGPDFVAMVVHELKAPISSVAAFAELLEDSWELFDDDRRREMAGAIGRQARPLVRLVDDLLTAARLEGGRLTVRAGPVDVQSTLRAALEAAALDPRAITLPASGLTAVGDGARVQQILVNLLTNAVRHGAPPVEVSVDSDASTVTVRVRDHGTGVSSVDAPRLFDRFSVLARGRSGSNGLGLYLSRQLARAMGGDVSYSAAEPGAVFAVRLPRMTEAEAPVSARAG